MPLVARYDVDGTTVETWGGSGFPTKAPREGKIVGMNMKADQGTVGTSAVPLPDPTGDHVLRGLRRTYWAETDCPADSEVIYDGYLQQRDYGRDPEHFTGSRRLITVNLVDLNNLLGTYLIQGPKDADHGFRPDETNIERAQWALGSAFLPPINDFGLVATGGGVDMDGADLRGQNMANVIRECAAVAGWQHFLYYDETQPTVNRIGLFLNPTDVALYSSTLRFSNHPGDADELRTAWGNMSALTFDFDSDQAPVQHRSPDTVYTGVVVEYDGGQVYVDCEEIGLTTKDDYYVRQTTLPAPNIKTIVKARAYGYQFLRDHDHEQDTASVRLLLPSTHIGLVKPGHRAEFRFDHFEPEYRDFTWWRIQDYTWAQKSRKWYWLDAEIEPLAHAEPAFARLYGCSGIYEAPGSLQVFWTSTGDAPESGLPFAVSTGALHIIDGGTPPTSGNPHYHGSARWTSVQIDGTGTVSIHSKGSFISVVVGGTKHWTVYLRKNGVTLDSQSWASASTIGADWNLNATGIDVVPGDIIDVYGTTDYGFFIPNGAGVDDTVKLEVSGTLVP